MRTLVLASGGLDSAVCAGMYAGSSVHLWINYGQVNRVQERAAAERIARHFGAPLHYGKVDVPGLAHSSVTTAGYGPTTGAFTVVPNRNAILLAMAVGEAERYACERVVIGCNAADHEVYADCRPAFIMAFNELARLATGGEVSVQAPLLYASKADIGRFAREMALPVEDTWSCYAPKDVGIDFKPCGECNACAGREEALADVHRCS